MFTIKVDTAFWLEQSDPINDSYLFIYTLSITNTGNISAQLLSRHWVITDGYGKIHEVHGDGVVGVQPKIAAGESFEYSSSCPLPTPFGTMHGEFYCIDETGAQFIVNVPLFILTAPNVVH